MVLLHGVASCCLVLLGDCMVVHVTTLHIILEMFSSRVMHTLLFRMSFHLPGITAALTSIGTLNGDKIWLQPLDYWIQSHPTHIPLMLLPSIFVNRDTFQIEVPAHYKITCAVCQDYTNLREAEAIRFGTPFTKWPAHDGLVCQGCGDKIYLKSCVNDPESRMFGDVCSVEVTNLYYNILAMQVIKKWRDVTRKHKIECDTTELRSVVFPCELPQDVLVGIATHKYPPSHPTRVVFGWNDCIDLHSNGNSFMDSYHFADDPDD